MRVKNTQCPFADREVRVGREEERRLGERKGEKTEHLAWKSFAFLFGFAFFGVSEQKCIIAPCLWD